MSDLRALLDSYSVQLLCDGKSLNECRVYEIQSPSIFPAYAEKRRDEVLNLIIPRESILSLNLINAGMPVVDEPKSEARFPFYVEYPLSISFVFNFMVNSRDMINLAYQEWKFDFVPDKQYSGLWPSDDGNG